jgi:HAD superfamily hydrolase (TIGR01459 family)
MAVAGGAERPELLSHLGDLASDYDGVLCDIWGVVHNGVRAWPDACEALTRFRDGGGRVVLISNAPRPGDFIRTLLDGLKVPRRAYDGIETSGDLTRQMLRDWVGHKAYHLGPERDRGTLEGLDISIVDEPEAEVVVTTGLFDDDHETPDDYRDMLADFQRRGLEMICANPDVVVERGDRLIYCAGALADAYEHLGGVVHWAGKPHPEIYDAALEQMRKKSARPVSRDRVLAIGDSVRTDLVGARDAGLDSLFVASGIHSAEHMRDDALDLASLEAAFRQAGVRPRAVISRLAW